MKRREFMTTLAGATMAAAAASLEAQEQAAAKKGPAKILFFGMTVVDRQSGFHLRLPTVGKHASFVLARDNATVQKLGLKPVAVSGSNIELAHKHLGGLKTLACLDGDPQFVISASTSGPSISQALEASLPNISTLYRKVEQKNPAIRWPEGTVDFEIGGGALHLPNQPSQNPGTLGVRWHFYTGPTEVFREGTAISDEYALTDILTLSATGTGASRTLKITRRAKTSETLELGEDETLWIFNLPTCSSTADEKHLHIESHHIHQYFEIFNSAPSKKVWSETFTEYNRPKSGKEFRHPCLNMQTMPDRIRCERDYKRLIPPDSDPCFAVMI